MNLDVAVWMCEMTQSRDKPPHWLIWIIQPRQYIKLSEIAAEWRISLRA